MFNNLRASRETELEEEFPSHVVCAWIGNSPDIARKHYLRVTDDHFNRALNIALHPSAKTSENEQNDAGQETPKTLQNKGFGAGCDQLTYAKVAEEGLEVCLNFISRGKCTFSDLLGIHGG